MRLGRLRGTSSADATLGITHSLLLLNLTRPAGHCPLATAGGDPAHPSPTCRLQDTAALCNDCDIANPTRASL